MERKYLGDYFSVLFKNSEFSRIGITLNQILKNKKLMNNSTNFNAFIYT